MKAIAVEDGKYVSHIDEEDAAESIVPPGSAIVWGNITGVSLEELARAREEGGGRRDHSVTLPLQGTLSNPTNICEVACGYRHILFASVDGILYSAGHGECGRLGHGNEESLIQPKVVLSLAQRGIEISKVAAGREHSIACTDGGIVYSWGWGEAGRLGLGYEANKVLTPTSINSLVQASECVVAAACGREHTLLATSTGRLYACGTGYGHGLSSAAFEAAGANAASTASPTRRKQQPEHMMALFPIWVRGGQVHGEEIVAISAGHAHSLAATATGLVLSWGFGGSGALGHGNDRNENEPKLVEALVEQNQAVLGVACGEYHSAAVTRDGHLWMWGDGAGGQLGVEGQGGEDKNTFEPICLNPSQELVMRMRDRAHMTRTPSGKSSPSQRDPSQLRTPSPSHPRTAQGSGVMVASSPTTQPRSPISANSKIPHRVVRVACGANHTIAVTENGQVYEWGCPEFASGADPKPRQLVPQLVARVQGTVVRSVAAVGAGGFHSALLTKRSDDGFDLIRSFESRKPVGGLSYWSDSINNQLGLSSRQIETSHGPAIEPVKIGNPAPASGPTRNNRYPQSGRPYSYS